VGDAFASDFLHFCAHVEWSFLAEETREHSVKATVERREALIIHLGVGHKRGEHGDDSEEIVVESNGIEVSCTIDSFVLRSDQNISARRRLRSRVMY